MRRSALRAALAVSVGFALPALAQEPPGERLLDDFQDPAAWSLVASDDVRASLRAGSDGRGGASLCIDFDFGRVTGYVAARRRLPVDFPERYELQLAVHGAMPVNDLQVKFGDAEGVNVWWARRPGFSPPAAAEQIQVQTQTQTLRWRQPQVEFAWGPTTDRQLQRSESVELVVASGSGAGKGSMCFDRLSLRALPPEPESPLAPTAQAASALDRHPASAAVDTDPGSDWQPAASAGDAAVLTVDYGRPRRFGLLTLRWRDDAAASRYRIDLSDDGVLWHDSRRVEHARGSVQRHFLADAEARFLQISVDEPASRAVALADVQIEDASDADAYFTRLARDAPRGTYPRAYAGEQPYWTTFGADGGPVASLLSEDGAVEPVPGVGAVEPFLVVDGRVLGWADVAARQTLRRGDLPMPAVHWLADKVTLDIEAFAIGVGATSPRHGDAPPNNPATAEATTQAIVRYRLRNTSPRPLVVALALAWRPFQVNPPTQFLAYPGGASRIAKLAWSGRSLQIDGVDRLQTVTRPAGVRLEPLAAGPAPAWLGEEAGPKRLAAERGSAKTALALSELVDPAGFPSAVLRFPMRLRPGEQREVLVTLPVSGAPPALSPAPSPASLAASERRVAAHWRQRLDRVRLTGPAEVTAIARTLRAALGQVLVNRSGPALQPGARAYARSWIRDGALTSAALLRLGQDDVVGDFLRWYAPFQFASGKIPCCATSRGADPVPENDSDGEFIFAVDEYRRYTRDQRTAAQLWPQVRAAARHLEALRQSERRVENLSADRRAYYGLMPPSISHEGYSDRPAYSYWDDFWAATGYRAAANLAAALGHPEDALRIGAERDEFTADLLASLAASTRHHGLDVLPGAADRGDVDPTSSSIALSPGDLLGTLPDDLVRRTFDRYWRDFLARRDAGRPWDAYTPYEWRNVGAFVRLGERERALQAMAFFRRDRRPAGWEQWAEVVGREPRTPRFIGDMPHGWVASDHIRSVLDLFAFEDASAGRLVLAAGVPMAWFDAGGTTLRRLRTPWGLLGWQARRQGTADRQRVIDFRVDKLRHQPPGGIELRGPWPAASRVSVDGATVAGPADRIRLPGTPAHVRIVLPDT